MDSIRISNLELFGHHGVHPEENVLGQKFVVDAVLYLDLAKAGLADRGRGETHFLAPLYQRAETLISPAAAMKTALDNGSRMEDIVAAYAEL